MNIADEQTVVDNPGHAPGGMDKTAHTGAPEPHGETVAIAYRPDVDGLRALAIIPVVLYHAGFTLFSGGFVGVDVFLVISGYLITSFIVAQIKAGTFSLRIFYLRRIRRIFPALFVMMAACAAIGWALLTPSDLRLLGECIVATVAFSSNMLFWLKAGYFSAPLEEYPLLHTWSLGVEEQFYLAFPLILILVVRFFPRRLVAAIVAIWILSFLLNVMTVAGHPRFAFYLAPPRMWELLTGALLTTWTLPRPADVRWSEAAGCVGAAMILAAIFGFSTHTAFPGVAALVPVIGTAAVIWSGEHSNNRLARLLSRKTPVFVGKISYSLYLWHFPLFAFAAYATLGVDSLALKLALIALSVTLACVSWWTIEQPVRRGRWIFRKPKVVFASAAAAVLLFAGAGLGAHFTNGFPGRLDSNTVAVLSAATDINPDRGQCLLFAEPDKPQLPPKCPFGAPAAAPEFAVWGDSHAESLRAGFNAAAKAAGRSGVFLGSAGCIPSLGIDRGSGGCAGVNQAVVDYLTSTQSIRSVVLSGRWALWAEGTLYKTETGPKLQLSNAYGAVTDTHLAVAAAIERAAEKLTAAGKTVWLVGPIPEIGYNVPRSLYLKSHGYARDLKIRPSLQDFSDRQSFVITLLNHLAAKYGARVVWPHQILCSDTGCQAQTNGTPLYIDDQHLTQTSALMLSSLFEPIFGAPIR